MFEFIVKYLSLRVNLPTISSTFTFINCLLITMLTVACSSKKSPSSHQFRALASAPIEMTMEEYNLNECFTNTKIACYELYPYDQVKQRWAEGSKDYEERIYKVRRNFDACTIDNSMSCSKLAGRNDLVDTLESSKYNLNNISFIQSLDWFFLSPAKVNRLIVFISNLNKLKKKITQNAKDALKTTKNLTLDALHGTGVGVTGSIFSGLGASFTGEAIVLNRELSLFCAPGLNLVSDIGAQANFSAVRALDCQNKEEYNGKFLSIQAGLSAEALLLPLGVEAAYSFGMDTTQFLKEILSYKEQQRINFKNLFSEFLLLESVLEQELLNLNFTSHQKVSLWLAIMLGKKMSTDRDSVGESPKGKEQIQKHAINLSRLIQSKEVSISKLIKGVLKSQAFQNIMHKFKLRNLKVFYHALEKSLTGCDSISGAVSLSLTLSPVNIGIMLNHYEEILSVDLEKITRLKNLTPFMLINPFLISVQTLRAVADLAYLFEELPGVIGQQCHRNAINSMHENFYLMRQL